MNYKIKYFLYYTCVLLMIFFGVIIITGLKEMISTKSFEIVIDLPNVYLVFIGIALWSFLMSYTAMPFYAKPSKKTFVFENKVEKKYIIKNIDEVVKTAMKESNIKKRSRIDVTEDRITYSCNIKILNYLFQPIIVHIGENAITVDSNIFFIKRISKVLNSK